MDLGATVRLRIHYSLKGPFNGHTILHSCSHFDIKPNNDKISQFSAQFSARVRCLEIIMKFVLASVYLALSQMSLENWIFSLLDFKLKPAEHFPGSG